MFGGQGEFELTFEKVFGNLEKMKETAERVNDRMKNPVNTIYLMHPISGLFKRMRPLSSLCVFLSSCQCTKLIV